MAGKNDRIPTPAPSEPAPDGGDGYEARTDKIVLFANVMLEAMTNVGKLKAKAVRADRWNPVLGVPPFPGAFLRTLNGYIEEWVDDAGVLQKVLGDDAPKLIGVAKRYDAAHEDAEEAVRQINP